MKKNVIYTCGVVVILTSLLWLVSYYEYAGIGTPCGKFARIEVCSAVGKVFITLTRSTKAMSFPLKVSSTSADEHKQRMVWAESLGLPPMAPDFQDEPAFSYVSGTVTFRQNILKIRTMNFPHWVLLIIFSIYPIICLGKRKLCKPTKPSQENG